MATFQAVRCSVCGLTVRPGNYGDQKQAIPGPHWPVTNEDTFMAYQSDYWGDADFSTFCQGSDKPGPVVNCELLSPPESFIPFLDEN